MKILNAAQIREVDRLSIEREPVSSIDLMERSAGRAWEIIKTVAAENKAPILVVCGTGNNGGDGLVIARKAQECNFNVQCIVVSADKSPEGSPDFKTNLQRLEETGVPFHIAASPSDTIDLFPNTIIIDALFGTGLSRPAEGIYEIWIKWMNASGLKTISIDIPSGLFSDDPRTDVPIVQAQYTLTFGCMKFSFVFPESARFCGFVYCIDIGWDAKAVAEQDSNYHFIQAEDLAFILKPIDPFAYKNTRGHVLISGGSKGMYGAPMLSAKAAFRVGAGLVSVHIPQRAETIVHQILPDALCVSDEEENYLSRFPKANKFHSLAIGMGMGANSEQVLKQAVIEFGGPIVIDADAIHYLSENLTWMSFLPKGCVLTPHPGEMANLLKSKNFRLNDVVDFAVKHMVYINLKGSFSALITPTAKVFFNGTGTSALAVAGTGDVLSGMIAGFLAQGYSTVESVLLGNGLHGLAGQLVEEKLDITSTTASDVIEHIGVAIRNLRSLQIT